jgi:hypothetical protein
MKEININFSGFWKGFEKENNFFYNILKKYYKINISEVPEYLFVSVFSKEHFKYDCIKIFYTGECISPNFNLFDYAIGFDHIKFPERYLRLPVYFMTYLEDSLKNALSKNTRIITFTQGRKDKFCSFVYSNINADPMRTVLFNKINSYRKVDSGGKFLKNIDSPIIRRAGQKGDTFESLKRLAEEKRQYESAYKFSIACENTSYPGYTTEKIIQSFAAGTIPIYWGDPVIGEIVNKKAFINVMDYKDLDEMLQVVKEIDSNDNQYFEMLQQPVFLELNYFKEVMKKADAFLRYIIDQPLVSAKKIPRGVFAKRELQSYYSRLENEKDILK